MDELAQAPVQPKQLAVNKGFSLIEVSFAIAILAICLGGLAASLVNSAQAAQANLRRNVAYNAAQMYLAQILNMPDSLFVTILNDPADNPFPTISIQTDNEGNKSLLDDPIDLNYAQTLPGDSNSSQTPVSNSHNSKQFPFRRNLSTTGSVEVENMDIVYTLYVKDLSKTTPAVNAYMVVLDFSYIVPYLHSNDNSLKGRVFGLKPFQS